MIDMKTSCSRHAEMPAHQLSSSIPERTREIGPLSSQARAKKGTWARGEGGGIDLSFSEIRD